MVIEHARKAAEERAQMLQSEREKAWENLSQKISEVNILKYIQSIREHQKFLKNDRTTTRLFPYFPELDRTGNLETLEEIQIAIDFFDEAAAANLYYARNVDQMVPGTDYRRDKAVQSLETAATCLKAASFLHWEHIIPSRPR